MEGGGPNGSAGLSSRSGGGGPHRDDAPGGGSGTAGLAGRRAGSGPNGGHARAGGLAGRARARRVPVGARRRAGRSRGGPTEDRARRIRRRIRRLLALLVALPVLGALALVLGSRPPAPFEPRDRPLPPGPPPERVVVLGTSLSARNDWPEALGAALGECLGRPVAVEVIARPGASSAWGLAQVGRVAATEPELVIVEFAINDADLLDGPGLGRSRAVHDTLLSELRALAPGARVLLMTTNHARGPRGWVRPRLGAHYALYPRLAERHGAGLVDLYPRWLARPRGADGLADGLHPTDEAARAVILPPLLDVLTGDGTACG